MADPGISRYAFCTCSCNADFEPAACPDCGACAEDVLTTGGSVREMITLVEEARARVVGVASLADRSELTLQFPARKESLLRLPLVTYQPDNCPLCEQGIPLVKPGSRPEPVKKP